VRATKGPTATPHAVRKQMVSTENPSFLGWGAPTTRPGDFENQCPESPWKSDRR
jgi:hypothetical protein